MITLRFNTLFFISFLLLFCIEIAIALFLKTGFVRFTVGDFLAVIMLYCFIRSLTEVRPMYCALAVLIFAYSLEILQALQVLDYFNLGQYPLLTTVLGNHFSFQDLVAYTLGLLCILSIDLIILKYE